MKAGLRQLRYDDAPDQPDRKAVMQGEPRPVEIAAGDVFTCRLPELLILWVPVRNPASAPFGDAGIDGPHVIDHFVLPYACTDDSRGRNRWLAPSAIAFWDQAVIASISGFRRVVESPTKVRKSQRFCVEKISAIKRSEE